MQDLVNIVTLAAIYVLFALGLSLVWGTTGILNFGHGVFFMFSAFAASLLTGLRLPLVVMVAAGMAVGSALSVATQLLAFGPILNRARSWQAAEMQILIAGIGVSSIPLAVVTQQTSDQPFSFEGGTFTPTVFTVAGVRVSDIQIIIIVLGLALGLGLRSWLARSRAGLALRALGVDAETSSLMGVNRRTLALAAMALSGALAGLAGVLLTYYLGSLTAAAGDNLLLKGFAAVVLGGVTSTVGVMAGALVLATAETLVLTQTSGTWVDAVSFGIIFLILLVRPQGLFGRAAVTRT